MEKSDKFFLSKGDKLKHVPTGLEVEVLWVGWDSHYVRFPRGAEMSIEIGKLEFQEGDSRRTEIRTGDRV